MKSIHRFGTDEIRDFNLFSAFKDGLLMFKEGVVFLSKERYIFVISLIKGFCTLAWVSLSFSSNQIRVR